MKPDLKPFLLLAGVLWFGALPPVSNSAWALKLDDDSYMASDVGVDLSWGRWDRDFYDPWRWHVGIGTGYPYWRHSSWHQSSWHHSYWRDDWGYWRYPYRYQPRKYRKPKPLAPPQRVTTSFAQSDAIHSLPANARVRVKEGRTVYEWQGVEYIYDWSSDSYLKLE